MLQIITDSDQDTERMIEIAGKYARTRGAFTVLLKNAYEEIAKINGATWTDWENVLKSVKSKFNL